MHLNLSYLSNTLSKHPCDYIIHICYVDSKPIQSKECKIEIEYGIKDSSENASGDDLKKQTDHKMQIDAKDFNSTELPHISGSCF